MTKENKLALIVGFTLILVVGVLISDHLSAASRARLDGVTVATAEPAPLGGSLAPGSDMVIDPLAGAPTANASPRPADLPRSDDVLGPGPLVIEQGQRVRAPDVVQDFLERLGQASPPALAETGRGEEPRRRTQPTPRQEQPRASVSTYTVRSGDSLFRIADRFLGDGHRWREIADLNRDAVGRNGSVRVGVTLVLPGGAARSAAVQPSREPARAVRTHTVRAGETLGDIARETMGSARFWPKLYDANKDKINNPDRVPVGTVLTIPAG